MALLPHVARGGSFYRVCGPDWGDPADTTYSKMLGGRWNSPGSFGVLHLNENLEGARANARRFIVAQFGSSILPEDIRPEYLPDLAVFTIKKTDFVDAVTADGRHTLRLAARYESQIGYDRCRQVARAAYIADEQGIAAASAVTEQSEELAVFDRAVNRVTNLAERRRFQDWWTAIYD